jgi:hypothetical protein
VAERAARAHSTEVSDAVSDVDGLVRALAGQLGNDACLQARAYGRYRNGDEVHGTDAHRQALAAGLVEWCVFGRGRNRQSHWSLTPAGEARGRALRENTP